MMKIVREFCFVNLSNNTYNNNNNDNKKSTSNIYEYRNLLSNKIWN